MAPRTFKKAIVAVSGTFPGYKQGAIPLTLNIPIPENND